MPNAEDDALSSAMSGVSVSCGASGGAPDLVQDTAAADYPTYGGIADKTGLKLIWEKKDWSNIYDCAFFNGDQIAIITFEKDDKGNKKNFDMRAVDLKGKPVEVPFPVFFTKPLAVCGSRDGNTLAITDRDTKVKPSKYLIHIYKQKKKRWTTRQIEREKTVNPVTIMHTGEIVCGNSSQVTMYTLDDRVRWEFDLPGEHKYVPWLTTSQSGFIIVGNANKDDIIVLNDAGQQVQQFPTQFLKLPSSICVDSLDLVLVYDHSNKTISLFTMEGEFEKKLTKVTWSPGTFHLHQDKYLLSRNFDKLFLHELV